jgi:aquaporin Z
MRNSKILIAEAVGTFVLMLGGPGTAVLAGNAVGTLGIALGFGLALLVAAYAIGPISGCHINPAVTLGLAITRKIEAARVPSYLIGQIAGAAAGGFTIWAIRHGAADSFDANPDTFAANLWGANHGFYNFGAMAATEIILTALLVLVVLTTTRKGFPVASIGLTVGLALTLIHLISIPVDNTSVNPARSFGMAIFAGGDAIEQLWAFVVFPLVGAVVGVLVWLAIDDASLEDTMLSQSASATD